MLEMGKIFMKQHFLQEKIMQLYIHCGRNCVSACKGVDKTRKWSGKDSDSWIFTLFYFKIFFLLKFIPGLDSQFCSV